MRRNETSMHVNSESSYKQVPVLRTLRAPRAIFDSKLAISAIRTSAGTGKRYRFSIQKWFKKVMAKKKDLFALRHASSLLGTHGQINQNHSSFIPMVVVVVDVKGRSFHF